MSWVSGSKLCLLSLASFCCDSAAPWTLLGGWGGAEGFRNAEGLSLSF